jgi:hypothetical protein
MISWTPLFVTFKKMPKFQTQSIKPCNIIINPQITPKKTAGKTHQIGEIYQKNVRQYPFTLK